jgi:hypothetical protein
MSHVCLLSLPKVDKRVACLKKRHLPYYPRAQLPKVDKRVACLKKRHLPYYPRAQHETGFFLPIRSHLPCNLHYKFQNSILLFLKILINKLYSIHTTILSAL